jgi:hypothetical protein
MDFERQKEQKTKNENTASSPNYINLEIMNNQTRETQRARLQDDVTLQELTTALLGTPFITAGYDTDGFQFDSMTTGNALPMDIPLRELGIREGEMLRISPGLTVAGLRFFG